MRISTPLIAFSALAVTGAWAGVATAAYYFLPDWPTRGQFGDVFGAVNALFSGLAFAGLIIAILLQREELQLQREELSATREELSRTAKAQEQSEIALRAQANAAALSSRLATIDFLMNKYRQELAALRGVIVPGHDPRVARISELERREAVLMVQLESLFEEVTGNERAEPET